MSATARDWDAATYDRVSDPQLAWSAEVIDRLGLTGGETVLDAGCGSGRVTVELARRLPRGRVIAVDASPSMVELAAKALGKPHEAIAADLAGLRLDTPVDAVFSNAVFHWIADHDALFDSLFALLRPGGRVAAQCGGAGNIDRFREIAMDVGESGAFAPYFDGWHGPWNYAVPEATAARLQEAGFEECRTWLEDRPVTLDEPEDYLRTVCLGSHLERLPPELKDPYVDAVVEASADAGGRVELAYVRLNIDARRPTG